MDPIILLILSVILGIVAIYFGFKCINDSYEEHKKLLTYRAYGILIVYFGFSVHTLGEIIFRYYGEFGELLLESIAHVIILISFIYFYKTSVEATKITKEYWFK